LRLISRLTSFFIPWFPIFCFYRLSQIFAVPSFSSHNHLRRHPFFLFLTFPPH
jgi:cell shape-determining protein MreD